MKYLLISLLGLGVLHAEPVSLFDGKTLAGWQVHPGEERFWKVQDGAITGGSLEEKVPSNTFLASVKSYENFDLTYKLRLVKGEGFQNSGMQIRSIRNQSHMKGYQVDGGIGYWGDLYDEGRRAKLGGALDPAALKAVAKDWDWNEYRVLCEGTRIQVWINGVAVTDYTEKDKTIPADGVFGLQAHSGGKFLVQIKEVMIKELPPTLDSAKWGAAKAEVKPAAAKPEANKVQAPAGTLSPEEQIKGFKVPEGYTVELVSSEKEGTEKPITVVWDRHGKMWTMTATEYPLDANENKEAAAALYASGGKDRILIFDEPNSNKVQTPRVFAEGLAIPLGILPMMDGVLAQYGTQIRRYIDDNKDGKADRFEVVLEGFGIQDSHLYVHQFERIPGGWIHLAQGAFNSSEVRRPGGLKFNDGAESVTFNNCKLGRFKPDGSLFQAQTAGPNNIWGLVISRTGETYIQEANDGGNPVMEFVTGSNYPTPFGPRMREDAPIQPASLKGSQMGGTGLSGLALAEDEGSPFAKDFPESQVFYIPNPITSKIQIVTMTRDAKGHTAYKKGPDFMQTDDKSFRPIAAHFGPDGCLYVVDWYNKIISHNEVARAHPDRDKVSGRIWRIRHKDQAVAPRVDLAKLDGAQLLAQLGGPNARTAAMAWHEIVDRNETKLVPDLKKILSDAKASDAKRLGALWALEGLKEVTPDLLVSLSKYPQATFRHEAARIAGEASLPESDFLKVMEALRDDPHFRVRAMVINSVRLHREASAAMVEIAAGYAKAPLPAGGRDAYDREFERYLVRWAMSSHPEQTQKMMTEMKLSDETIALAARSLEGEAAAVMLVNNLEKMKRSPTAQELGILAKYIKQPVVQDGFKKLLGSKDQRQALLSSLLQVDASVANLPDFVAAVGDACVALLQDARNPENERLVVDVARRFRISKLGDEVRAWSFSQSRKPDELAVGLAALREIKILKAEDCKKLLDHADDIVRREAVTGFASMPGPEVIDVFAKLWATLPGALRSIARDGMTSNKVQAEAFTKALSEGKFGQVDISSVEKVSAVLGQEHPTVMELLKSQEGLLKSVICLTGGGDDRLLTNVTLNTAFTVETWINLNNGVSQADGLLGRKGGADFNFFGEKLRVYGGPGLGDLIVSKRTIKAGEWIHCAITRDSEGRFAIYLDGELDSSGSKTSTETFTGLNMGETTDNNGSAAMYDEYRIWNVARTAEQIRMDFRTDYSGVELPSSLVLRITGKELSKFKMAGKASAVPISDFPALLTTVQRDQNEAKFRRFEGLAKKAGDAEKGRALAEATCFICHQVNGKGMTIGPDLSGAGAMGVESLLRNILTPNEQLESGYYRHDVRLTNDSMVSGFLSGETADSIKIRRIGADELVIPKKDILAHDISKRSLMPEGLIDGFTDQQVSDLFSFLNQLK